MGLSNLDYATTNMIDKPLIPKPTVTGHAGHAGHLPNSSRLKPLVRVGYKGFRGP